jgi:hypothetical protein
MIEIWQLPCEHHKLSMHCMCKVFTFHDAILPNIVFVDYNQHNTIEFQDFYSITDFNICYFPESSGMYLF